MATDAPVLFHLEGKHIGVLTLNRPDNRNSMTSDLLDAFVETTGRIRSQKDLRCVIITGKGRCFSAGADLRAQVQREDTGRKLETHERSYAMYVPFLSVLDIEVPTIAALNGHAVGGGFGLSLVCDIRVANESAKVGANFSRLGFSSGMAVSYILPRLVGISKAAELLFTGRLISGEEAERIGLVSYALPAQEVFPKALEIATEIAQSAPLAVRKMKKLFFEGLDFRPRPAAMAEAFAQAETIATADAKEGMAALLEKREPKFTGG
jgi:enoyl-CoA hydratase/carnithine racemase